MASSCSADALLGDFILKNVIFRKLSFHTSLPGTMEFLFSLLIWKNDYSFSVKILVMCFIETIPEAVVKNNGNFATNNMLHHHDKYTVN
jgi:hypothetical protein